MQSRAQTVGFGVASEPGPSVEEYGHGPQNTLLLALIPDQPVHRLFARLECGQIPLGKALEVFVKNAWQTFSAYPGSPFHIGTIEHENLLRPPRHLFVDLYAREVRKRQNRSGFLPRDGRLNHVEQQQRFFRDALAEVNDQNGLPFMLHKAQPIVEEFVRTHASIPSTTA